MQIGSHQHFWRYDAARDAWIADEMRVLQRDFLPERLEPDAGVVRWMDLRAPDLPARLDQPFVVDHVAKPAVAAHPDVFCKLSGLVAEANWDNWNQERGRCSRRSPERQPRVFTV